MSTMNLRGRETMLLKMVLISVMMFSVDVKGVTKSNEGRDPGKAIEKNQDNSSETQLILLNKLMAIYETIPKTRKAGSATQSIEYFENIVESRSENPNQIIKLCFMNIEDNSKVLDLGSGVGFHSLELSKKYQVTAVEPDLESLAFGVVNNNYKDCNIIPTILQEVSMSLEGHFDAAFSYAWLIPQDEQKEYFKSLHRLLKPKATVYLWIQKSERKIPIMKEAFDSNINDFFQKKYEIDYSGEHGGGFIKVVLTRKD